MFLLRVEGVLVRVALRLRCLGADPIRNDHCTRMSKVHIYQIQLNAWSPNFQRLYFHFLNTTFCAQLLTLFLLFVGILFLGGLFGLQFCSAIVAFWACCLRCKLRRPMADSFLLIWFVGGKWQNQQNTAHSGIALRGILFGPSRDLPRRVGMTAETTKLVTCLPLPTLLRVKSPKMNGSTHSINIHTYKFTLKLR